MFSLLLLGSKPQISRTLNHEPKRRCNVQGWNFPFCSYSAIVTDFLSSFAATFLTSSINSLSGVFLLYSSKTKLKVLLISICGIAILILIILNINFLDLKIFYALGIVPPWGGAVARATRACRRCARGALQYSPTAHIYVRERPYNSPWVLL